MAVHKTKSKFKVQRLQTAFYTYNSIPYTKSTPALLTHRTGTQQKKQAAESGFICNKYKNHHNYNNKCSFYYSHKLYIIRTTYGLTPHRHRHSMT